MGVPSEILKVVDSAVDPHWRFMRSERDLSRVDSTILPLRTILKRLVADLSVTKVWHSDDPVEDFDVERVAHRSFRYSVPWRPWVRYGQLHRLEIELCRGVRHFGGDRWRRRRGVTPGFGRRRRQGGYVGAPIVRRHATIETRRKELGPRPSILGAGGRQGRHWRGGRPGAGGDPGGD